MKLYYVCLSMLVTFFVACNDEDNLVPTDTPEFGYRVPQGNHDYDDQIVAWNERCNTFILYKFNLKELYWAITSWEESKPTPEDHDYQYPYLNSGFVGEVADENYVGQQLSLLEDMFLNFFPDTTLRRCLPLKLLLCSKLFRRDVAGNETFLNIKSGYDYLAFNWGNGNILNMTDKEKNSFKQDVNTTFLERLINSSKIVPTEVFYEEMNYKDKITQANMYARGFLSAETDQKKDILFYIRAIVSTPYEDLLAEPADKDYTYMGILNSKKDVNGYIRKKYNVLVDQFKEDYGIDLQAIGNATLK